MCQFLEKLGVKLISWKFLRIEETAKKFNTFVVVIFVLMTIMLAVSVE